MQLLNELSNRQFRWCIAGGFAACPQLATDCDVWVFRDKDGQGLFETRETLIRELEGLVRDGSDPGDQAAIDAYISEHPNFMVLRVGRINDCHLMVTSAEDIDELLSGFDVSTHQCAIDDSGQFIKGVGWTPLTVPPVALLDTERTSSRMAKITERYAAFRVA